MKSPSPYVAPGVPRESELEWILRRTAAVFLVDPEWIKGKLRYRHIVFARHAYCYVARIVTKEPLRAIGELISRDHSSVLHSIKTAEILRETNYMKFDDKIKKLADWLI